MADANAAAFVGLVQAIAHGAGTPQQRAAVQHAIAQQMGQQFNAAMSQAGQQRLAGGSGGAGLAPTQQLSWLPQALAQQAAQAPPPAAQAPPPQATGTGGAGLAPPPGVNPGGQLGSVNPGGVMQGIRPGGPVHPIGPARPGVPRRGGPVRAIGPARPPRAGGGAHWYGPGGSGVIPPQ